MKVAAYRPYADPEAATRTLVDIASGIEPVQDGRIYIDLMSAPFLKSGASGPEFDVGLYFATERGWLELHESAPYVRTEGSQACRHLEGCDRRLHRRYSVSGC